MGLCKTVSIQTDFQSVFTMEEVRDFVSEVAASGGKLGSEITIETDPNNTSQLLFRLTYTESAHEDDELDA